MAGDSEEDVPLVISMDQHAWKLLVESFSDRILWDADYLLNDGILDHPPATEEEPSDTWVLRDQYFGAVAAEPNDSALQDARSRLQRLLLRSRTVSRPRAGQRS